MLLEIRWHAPTEEMIFRTLSCIHSHTHTHTLVLVQGQFPVGNCCLIYEFIIKEKLQN